MQLTAIQKTTLLDYPGKVATLVFTPGCNLRCGFCHNPEFVLPERLEEIRHDFIPEEVFFRFLQTRAGFLDGVVICGGEPTIHKDLPEFCKRIKDLGFLVKLDTNGSNPEVLEHLFSQELVDYIAMDLKNPLEKYASLTGKEIDISRYRESIKLIRTRAPDYEFRTTLIGWAHSIEDMDGMGKEIDGGRRWFLQNYRGGNTLEPAFEGRSLLLQELEWFREIGKKYTKDCIIRN